MLDDKPQVKKPMTLQEFKDGLKRRKAHMRNVEILTRKAEREQCRHRRDQKKQDYGDRLKGEMPMEVPDILNDDD